MRYLTMGAMFCMENSWLDEWIQYHLAVGVEHFVLYNDDVDTRVSDKILKPYVDQGLVENIHIRKRPEVIRDDRSVRQIDTYKDLIRNAVSQTRWLAIVDIDEFILPRRCDDIRTFLEEYEEYNGLAMNWTIFGTSGYIKRSPSQINHLLHRGEMNWERNHFVKSIIKPDRAIIEAPWLDIPHIHFSPTRDGVTVNENHEPVTGATHGISTEKIRLNHYILRSWQDFWEVKATRPRLGYGSLDEGFFNHDDRNEVFDEEISRRFGHVVRDLR